MSNTINQTEQLYDLINEVAFSGILKPATFIPSNALRSAYIYDEGNKDENIIMYNTRGNTNLMLIKTMIREMVRIKHDKKSRPYLNTEDKLEINRATKETIVYLKSHPIKIERINENIKPNWGEINRKKLVYVCPTCGIRVNSNKEVNINCNSCNKLLQKQG